MNNKQAEKLIEVTEKLNSNIEQLIKMMSIQQVPQQAEFVGMLSNVYTNYADLAMHENAQVRVRGARVFLTDSQNQTHQINPHLNTKSSWIQAVSFNHENNTLTVKMKSGEETRAYNYSKTAKMPQKKWIETVQSFMGEEESLGRAFAKIRSNRSIQYRKLY